MHRRRRSSSRRAARSSNHLTIVPTPVFPGARLGVRGSSSRVLLFGLLCAVCILGAVGYAALAAARSPFSRAEPGIAASTPGTLALPADSPSILFRSTALDPQYGQVVLAPLDDPTRPYGLTGLQCDRVYFAASRGLCLAVDRGIVTTARAIIFDDQFERRHEVPLNGIPSRVRLSPDGRFGASTTFVRGHSYAGDGFSTETTLLDIEHGTALGTLEEFAVWRDGERMQSPDFNFWGVTFSREAGHFYATLATAGRTYLIGGSVADRQVQVIHEGVECPSLSPDETRVAFKRRVNDGGLVHWQPYILDLATLVETPLNEARSIDDQIEWLDDHRILYALPESSPSAVTHVWRLLADGSGQPELFLEKAASPAVIHARVGNVTIGASTPGSQSLAGPSASAR
jgi:hypothetical protein